MSSLLLAFEGYQHLNYAFQVCREEIMPYTSAASYSSGRRIWVSIYNLSFPSTRSSCSSMTQPGFVIGGDDADSYDHSFEYRQS